MVKPDGAVIRPVTLDDAEAVCAILNAAIVDGRHSLLDTPFSVDDERRYIADFPSSGIFMVAELPQGGRRRLSVARALRLVRHARLRPRADGGDLRARVVPATRASAGRSPRAASTPRDERAARQVLTEIRIDNDASLRFYLGLGFAVVGVAHDLARLGGRFA